MQESTPNKKRKTEEDKEVEKKPPANKKDSKSVEKVEELSSEDQALKDSLDLYVERTSDKDADIQKNALLGMSKAIKESTSSMTSVPKPLKFLRPHYDTLKKLLADGFESKENEKLLADVLSVLAMTMAEEGTRESLKYKLAGDTTSIGEWGHEYIRNLAGEISDEYAKRKDEDEKSATDDLLVLVEKIIPFNMQHNAEPEACDLLMEVEQLQKIVEYIDKENFKRVCLYLISCSQYVPEPDDSMMLRLAYQIYEKMEKIPSALRLAIKLNDSELISSTFENCTDPVVKKQLGYILAENNLFIYTNEDTPEEETLTRIVSNRDLSSFFLELAKDLEVMEPKEPEDVYKKHLVDTRSTTSVDSAKQNLASTFVNAFLNAGFGTDKKMTVDGNTWIYRNRDQGMMCAAASLGMIYLWDSDGGCSEIDPYTYSDKHFIKAGSLLGVGICNSRVHNSFETALGILSESVESPTAIIRVGAILGLGIAYAGTGREDLQELIAPVFEDSEASIEVLATTALSLGLIFCGTKNPDVTASIVDLFLTRSKTDITSSVAKFLSLGLGLLYLKTQEGCELTLETLKVLELDEDAEKAAIGKYASFTVETCAYAGTGNVLKIQKMLIACDDHLKENNAYQQVAVMGIALIAMGEELGTKMAIRAFNHLLQYGELNIRRAIPLAFGLLNVSHPEFSVMDTLSKLTHDHDSEVAQAAIISLGLIGAGTNNARAANLLRQLSGYYYKDANHLFTVRLAQGLLHAGKGTLTLDPIHSNRMILSSVGLAGLLPFLHSALSVQEIIINKPYFMYTLACSMRPRVMMTLDTDLKPLQVPVRVGQAVDVVGQAGKPKSITGFQTHDTPVLLGHGDRAELVTDDYIAVADILEGFVVLKENPDKKKKKDE